MPVSIFDLFSVGVGPSSSHTIGPMRAARSFALQLDASDDLDRTASVLVELYGSLALTGRSHGTDKAVLLGLEGQTPEGVDVDRVEGRLQGIRESRRLTILGKHPVELDESEQLVFRRSESLPYHPNGMRFTAYDDTGAVLRAVVYYSVGGGFVVAGARARPAGPRRAEHGLSRSTRALPAPPARPPPARSARPPAARVAPGSR